MYAVSCSKKRSLSRGIIIRPLKCVQSNVYAVTHSEKSERSLSRALDRLVTDGGNRPIAVCDI